MIRLTAMLVVINTFTGGSVSADVRRECDSGLDCQYANNPVAAFQEAKRRIAELPNQGGLFGNLIYGDNVLDLSGLGALTELPDEILEVENLTEITINNTSVVDFGVLTDLTDLERLVINYSPARDFSFLEGMNQLVHLDLSRTGFKGDVGPIEMDSLQNLYLLGTQISNLSWLESADNLTKVDLRQTNILSLDDFPRFDSLEVIRLPTRVFEDPSPLLTLPNLENVRNLIQISTNSSTYSSLEQQGVRISSSVFFNEVADDLTDGWRPVVQTGQHGLAFDLTVSPDGTLLATATSNGEIQISDTGTEYIKYVLDGGSERLALSFLPNSLSLVSVGNNIRLWDLQRPSSFTEFGHPVSYNGVVSVLADGQHIATSVRDFRSEFHQTKNAVEIWNVSNGRYVGALSEGLTEEVEDRIVAIQEDRNGLIIVGTSGGKIIAFDIENNGAIYTIVPNEPRGSIVKILPSSVNDRAVAVYRNGHVLEWSTLTGVETRSCALDGPILSAASEENSSLIWMSQGEGSDASILQYDLATCEIKETYLNDFLVSIADLQLVGSNLFFNATRGWAIYRGNIESLSGARVFGQGGGVLVNHVSFLGDGSRFTIGTPNRGVKIFNASTGEPEWNSGFSDRAEHSYSVPNSGTRVAGASRYPNIIRIRSPFEGELEVEIEEKIDSLSLSEDGRLMAVGGDRNTLIFDLSNLSPPALIEYGTERYLDSHDHVAFIDSGAAILIGIQSELALFSTKNRSLVRRFLLPDNYYLDAFSVSEDQKRVFVLMSSEDTFSNMAVMGAMAEFDIQTGRMLSQIFLRLPGNDQISESEIGIRINSFRVHEGSSRILLSTSEGHIGIWRQDEQYPEYFKNLSNSSVWADISNDYLLIGRDVGRVSLVSLDDYEVIYETYLTRRSEPTIVYTDGTILTPGSRSGTVVMWLGNDFKEVN